MNINGAGEKKYSKISKFLKKCFKASFLIILLILHKEVMSIWNQLEGAVPNDT